MRQEEIAKIVFKNISQRAWNLLNEQYIILRLRGIPIEKLYCIIYDEIVIVGNKESIEKLLDQPFLDDGDSGTKLVKEDIKNLIKLEDRVGLLRMYSNQSIGVFLGYSETPLEIDRFIEAISSDKETLDSFMSGNMDDEKVIKILTEIKFECINKVGIC